MFIEFGILKLKLLILLIYPIALIPESNINSRFADISSSILYNIFISYTSFLSVGIIYLIILFRSRSSNKTVTYTNAVRESAIGEFEQHQKEKKKRQKTKKIQFLFLLALLYFLCFLLSLLFNKSEVKKNYSVKIGLLSLFYSYMFFSKFLLNEKIYKHHAISIIIISICCLILSIYDLLIKGSKESEDYKFEIRSFLILIIFSFSIQILYALFSVLIKVHFNTYLTDPFLLMFYLGIFGLLILIPIEIIYHYCLFENDKILGKGIISEIIELSKNDLKNIFYIFCQVFLDILINGSEVLTIYYFKPCHLTISLMIHATIERILDWGKNAEKNGGIQYKIFFIFVNVSNIIFSLIYNEIIIIKICSLEKNTTKYISKRQKSEYIILGQVYNSDEDEENNNRVSIDSNFECVN